MLAFLHHSLQPAATHSSSLDATNLASSSFLMTSCIISPAGSLDLILLAFQRKSQTTTPPPPPPIISVLNLVEQLSCCQYSFANQLVLSPVNVLPELHKERKWIYIRAGPSTSVIIYVKGIKDSRGKKIEANSFHVNRIFFPLSLFTDQAVMGL